MEEKLQEIINNLKSITEKDMLSNYYSQWNNPKRVLAEDIKELEKALEERDNLKHKLIDVELQNTLHRQTCESKDRKIAELKDSINDFNEALNKLKDISSNV